MERFIGPWDSVFDIVPDLTESDKEALYGLIELSTNNQNKTTWRVTEKDLSERELLLIPQE